MTAALMTNCGQELGQIDVSCLGRDTTWELLEILAWAQISILIRGERTKMNPTPPSPIESCIVPVSGRSTAITSGDQISLILSFQTHLKRLQTKSLSQVNRTETVSRRAS